MSTVELNVSEAAPVLGVSPAALRERIKRGAQEGRVAENGLYLARIRERRVVMREVVSTWVTC